MFVPGNRGAGISFLYITHDLSTAYQIGDQIYILYQGAVAEKGRTIDVIDHPSHPYVQQTYPKPNNRLLFDARFIPYPI